MRYSRLIVRRLSLGLICVICAAGGSVLMPSGAHGQTRNFQNPRGQNTACIIGTIETSEGRVTQCRLSKTQTFVTEASQKISCAGGSWVRFFDDGALRFCRLAAALTLKTAAPRAVSCLGGNKWIRPAKGIRIRDRDHAYGYAVFDRTGALIACTLATTAGHARRAKGGQWLDSVNCAGTHPARFWGLGGGLRACVLSTKLGIKVAKRKSADCAALGWAAFSKRTGNLLACVAARDQSFTNTRNKKRTCRTGAEMWFSERGALERCSLIRSKAGVATKVFCIDGTKKFHASKKLKRCRLARVQLLWIGSRQQVRCSGRSMASFAPSGALTSCRLSTVQRVRAADGHAVSCAGGNITQPPAQGAAEIEGRSKLAFGVATFAPNGVVTGCTLSVKQSELARDSRGKERQRVECAGERTAYFHLKHGGIRACVLPAAGKYATARRKDAQCQGGAWASFSRRSGGLISCIASADQRHVNTAKRLQNCAGGALVQFAESGLLIKCAKSAAN